MDALEERKFSWAAQELNYDSSVVQAIDYPLCPLIYRDTVIVKIFIINIISFLQGIYTNIPETNHDSMEYSVAPIL